MIIIEFGWYLKPSFTTFSDPHSSHDFSARAQWWVVDV